MHHGDKIGGVSVIDQNINFTILISAHISPAKFEVAKMAADNQLTSRIVVECFNGFDIRHIKHTVLDVHAPRQ